MPIVSTSQAELDFLSKVAEDFQALKAADVRMAMAGDAGAVEHVERFSRLLASPQTISWCYALCRHDGADPAVLRAMTASAARANDQAKAVVQSWMGFAKMSHQAKQVSDQATLSSDLADLATETAAALARPGDTSDDTLASWQQFLEADAADADPAAAAPAAAGSMDAKTILHKLTRLMAEKTNAISERASANARCSQEMHGTMQGNKFVQSLAVGCGWAHSPTGFLKNGQPMCTEGPGFAFFKHSQALHPGDSWTIRCSGWKKAMVGFAGDGYDPERNAETSAMIACVKLGDGSSTIMGGLSLDGEQKQSKPSKETPGLVPHIRKVNVSPVYAVTLRCDPDGNVPQIQFNEDKVWHDFVPEGRAALKDGPWYPLLALVCGDAMKMEGFDCVSDFRVDRAKPTKSAGAIESAVATSAVHQSEGAAGGH